MPLSCRILHVEDSPDDAELARQSLQGAGLACSLERVVTEQDYVAQLDRLRPDLILCAYNVPRLSAERALQIIQERALHVPFIVISDHIDQSTAVIAMQRGASDYLSKRDLSRLPKAISAALDRAHSRGERGRSEYALRASEAMKRGILESLRARIAVVDRDGVVLAANGAWREFGKTGSETGIASAKVGDNYLQVLGDLAARGNIDAQRGIDAIRSVTRGELPFASLDYQVSVGSTRRWFLERVVPMEGSDHVVVSHQDITDQMNVHIALADAHRRFQVLSKRVLSIHEEERRAISRELHDDVGQTLTALKIGLHRLSTASRVEAPCLLSECLAAADVSLEKLRKLAQKLRPPQLDQLGLPDTLAWLADDVARTSGLRVAIDCRGAADRRYAVVVESGCYRIAQEAMSNVMRHARATKIHMALETDPRLLKLVIRDDGAGFDVQAARARSLQSGSLGIIGMEERAELAGGRIEICSIPGGGTTVTATFPFDAVRAASSGTQFLAEPT